MERKLSLARLYWLNGQEPPLTLIADLIVAGYDVERLRAKHLK